MQAVLLAAGQSSRMHPYNKSVHKSMISLLGKPILAHTIERLAQKGVTDIIIVTDPGVAIKNYFGDGKNFGVSLTYVVQKEPAGMGQAVLLAKDHIQGDFLLMNAYHADAGEFAEDLVSAKKQGVDSTLLVKKRKNVVDFGVVTVEGKRLISLIEKPAPQDAPSDVCVVGIYLFDSSFISELENTPAEHYQLEKAIASYAKQKNIVVVETQKETLSLKYPWDLFAVKDYLFTSLKGSKGNNSKIAKSAEISGEVIIEDNVTIMEGAQIKGPCYIGENVVIGNHALIRQGSNIEKDSVVGASLEVKNGILMAGVSTHSGFIGDSIVGEQTHIAAQFGSANVRLDKKAVEVTVKDKKVDSGRKYLGTMIGSNCEVGIKCSTMPGIIIGNGVTVGPSTTVLHNVADNTTYYTKFAETIEKK